MHRATERPCSAVNMFPCVLRVFPVFPVVTNFSPRTKISLCYWRIVEFSHYHIITLSHYHVTFAAYAN